jgi:hypothetical protein
VNELHSYGCSIVGEYGNIDDTIIYSDQSLDNVQNIRLRLRDVGWRFSDLWILNCIDLTDLGTLEPLELLDRLGFPPIIIDVPDSDSDDPERYDEVRMRGTYDTIKTIRKTIRKSPRNAFLGAFTKLVEAPDTEYTCLICHTDKSDEVPDPTKVLMTACGHLFHRFCIKEWVKKASTEPTGHNRCPACRTEIVAFHGPESTLNSQETDAVQTPKE